MTRRALLGLLMIMPVLAEAAGPLVPDEPGRGPDLSLRFTSAKMPLDYGDRSYDTTSRWIGLSLREKAGQRVTLGMYGGYAYVTQTGNPVTAGMELNGFHAGFSLYGVILESRHESLFYAFDYTYQKVDNKSDAQTVVIDWSQPQAQLGAIISLTQNFRFYGGGSYGRIDGEERVSGTVNRTTTISRAARGGGFLGLDLNTDPDGYVGIEVRLGLTRGGEIYFKRRY
ncbi:hypothetical protein [Sulfuricaulis sp.]|jgi:hypothetical protein|uniref:hypothetical protein n=1 Tax=Sulfuricaulis sp. TaxID=2003553 RepID=UPI00355A09B0